MKKTTKFERLRATGLFKSPYVENVLKKTWEEAANIHITVADEVIEQVKGTGRNVKIVRDY